MKKTVLVFSIVLSYCALCETFRYVGPSWGSTYANPAENWEGGVSPGMGASLDFSGQPNSYGVRVFGHKPGENSTIYYDKITGIDGWNLQLGTNVPVVVTNAADFHGVIISAGNTLQVAPSDGGTGRINNFAPNYWDIMSFNGYTPGIFTENADDVTEIGQILDRKPWRASGEGSLVIENANRGFGVIHQFGGDVRVKAGNEKDIEPAVAGVPFMHFDASDESTFELNADGRIEKWNDVSGNGVYAGRYQETVLPKVRKNYANGLSVVDFGAFSKSGVYKGEALEADGSNASAVLAPSDTRELTKEVFIVCADRAKFTTADSTAWSCPAIIGNDSVDFPRYPDGGFMEKTHSYPSASLSRFYVNGSRVLPDYNISGERLKVLSIVLNRPYKIEYFANDRPQGYYRGGIYLAEYIAYSNTLTQLERRQVISYLRNKWLEPDEVKDSEYDLNELNITAGSVSAAENETVRIKAVSLASSSAKTIVKKGAGTVEVNDVYPSKGISVEVAGGCLDFSHSQDVRKNDPQPAARPMFHFDADDETTFELVNEGGTNYVARWKDVRSESDDWCVSSVETNRPWRVENACNGRAVVDFGGLTYGGVAKKSGWMYLPSKVQSSSVWLREAFYVFKDKDPDSVAFVLGTKRGLQFHRGRTGTLLEPSWAAKPMVSALWAIDGVPALPGVDKPKYGEFNVVSFALPKVFNLEGVTLACDRLAHYGGIELAEMILYSRELTAEERHDTQAYLLKKWKNAPHPADIDSIELESVKFTGENPALGLSGVSATVRSLETDGAVNFSGDGEVTILNTELENGIDVRADGNDVSFQFEIPPATLHLDANDTASWSVGATEENGTNSIVRWNDVRGEGYPYAYHVTTNMSSKITDGAYPRVMEDVTNGLSVMSFGPMNALGEWNGSGQTEERYFKAVEYGSSGLELSRSIRVVEFFAVWGDYNDVKTDSFLLGQGSSSYKFHRGVRGEIFHQTHSSESYRNGIITLNGDEVPYSTVLPSGMSVVSVAVTNGSYLSATTLVRDRTRLGGTLIGELLVYDYSLTELERTAVLSYLHEKWHNRNLGLRCNVGVLEAGSGGSVTFSNTVVIADSVNGNGNIVSSSVTVKDGLSSGGVLGFDLAQGGALVFEDGAEIAVSIDRLGVPSSVEVDGAAEFLGTATVKVSLDADGKIAYGTYPVLTALDGIVFSGIASPLSIESDLTERCSMSLVVRGNELCLRIASTGTCIIIK